MTGCPSETTTAEVVGMVIIFTVAVAAIVLMTLRGLVTRKAKRGGP